MANSRGKILVDPKVQGALAKRVATHWCVFFLLSLMCLFSIEYFVGDPNLSIGGHLAVIWGKYAFFLLLMLAIVPSFVYDTIKMSHRFAGPIVRLKESIRRLADGEEVSELKFRGDDFWVEMSSDFNRVVQRINGPQPSPAGKDVLTALATGDSSPSETATVDHVAISK